MQSHWNVALHIYNTKFPCFVKGDLKLDFIVSALWNDTWCFIYFIVRLLKIRIFKNMMETSVYADTRCITSEWSWQTALVSPVFLFFLSLHFGKQKKIWIPAELKMDVCAAAVRSLTALQSHPCRGTMKDQLSPVHLKLSAANISSYYLFLIFLCPSLMWMLSFLVSSILCFHFDLHRVHTTFLSVQAGFLYCLSSRRGRDEQSCRKGSSLAVRNRNQLIFFFFFFPAFWQSTGTHTGMFTFKYVNVQLTIRTEATVGFNAPHID